MRNISGRVLLWVVVFALCACSKSPVTQNQSPVYIDSVLALIPCDSLIPVHTVCSSDSAICIYGWDNRTGGQMINWSAVYTVRDEDNVVRVFEGLPDWSDDDMSLITGIYTLPHPTRHLYLFESYFREWSAVAYTGLVTYERTGHSLRRVPLIRDAKGQLVEQTGFEYEALEVWREIISYWDEPTHAFLTDGYGSYQWNGTALEPLPVNIPAGSYWTNGDVCYQATLIDDSVHFNGITLHESGSGTAIHPNQAEYVWQVDPDNGSISEFITLQGEPFKRFDGNWKRQ